MGSRTYLEVVGVAGVEPTTCGFGGRHSIQLSYTPTIYSEPRPRVRRSQSFCDGNISLFFYGGFSILKVTRYMRRLRFIGTIIFALSWVCLSGCSRNSTSPEMDEFSRLMNSGKTYYEQGDAIKALGAFQAAATLQPTATDAYLNLANAALLAGQPLEALTAAALFIERDSNAAAAHYVAGCAHLRLNHLLEAVQSFQLSKDLNSDVAATCFQLGLAHFSLKHWEEAAKEFQSAVELEPEHPSAHYNFGQVLIRLGRTAESQKELDTHRDLLAKRAGQPPTVSGLERSIHTAILAPFKLEQPRKNGLPIHFVNTTAQAFGSAATQYKAPIGIMDINQRGANDLFVLEEGQGFRLLLNTNGVFTASGRVSPALTNAQYHKCLVADLQNDRFEDVIVVGAQGSHVFKFATNGLFTEVTAYSRLKNLAATDAALVDLDFSGKLDLLTVTARTNDLRLFRNLGNFLFKDITATSGIPTTLSVSGSLAVEDWNSDDLMDIIVARQGEAPLLMQKIRGGSLTATNTGNPWPRGQVFAAGDLNNDLRADLVVIMDRQLSIAFGGLKENQLLPIPPSLVTSIVLVDYDNDGWLDICTVGDGLHVYRNLGTSGFEDQTSVLGLAKIQGLISEVHFADFDQDGDSDLLVAPALGGLQLWRNEGAQVNRQLKVRLVGNRSNSSGIGVKVETRTGGLRNTRTVSKLPIEIGVGRFEQLDAVTVHWFNLSVPSLDQHVERAPITLTELILPEGSCPYLYVWDGERYRFVTDILGSAPLGLPAVEGVYIDADPFEYVWLGNRETFRPRNNHYEIQLTEELREVLYLDEVKLCVVDHPRGTEVHSTSKLRSRKPYPVPELVTVGNPRMLLDARDLEGKNITATLSKIDGQMISPRSLRSPQLRGLAELHGIVLDFGLLDSERPLVLALTGWLRFGGGMANMAASHDTSLPFPFPVLEVETSQGEWQRLEIDVGAPSGKTKTILIDLTGKLPKNARRLKLTAGFEIHWDRAALFDRVSNAETRIVKLSPTRTDLHWRGFSEFANLPPSQPLTPMYDAVFQQPFWRITPSGWATRYGGVDALLEKRDDALVLVCGGDELTLQFSASQIPTPSEGRQQNFYLYADGWDKDSDFHVVTGTQIEPMPWHGMNDQLLGREPLPEGYDTSWKTHWNTRWVGEKTLSTRASAKDGRAPVKR